MTGQSRLSLFGVTAVMLGSLALLPVIRGGSWFMLSLLGVTAIAAAGELCRRYRFPRPAVPLVQLGTLVLFITVSFASGQSVLGVIPGTTAFERMGTIAHGGFTDINKYAAPVPATEGIVFLAAVGICFVGLLVDLCAVTLRRAALTGLPLLALYSVAVAVVRDGVHWLIFAISSSGYLALLLAEGRDRVTQWGRPLRTTSTNVRALDRRVTGEVDAAPLTQVGRRIGATALGFAIVLPAVIPDVGHGFFGGGGSGFGNGSSRRIQTVNPMVTLKQDLNLPENRALLVVRTDNANAREQYLRDAVLDEFDGREWKPSKPQLEDVPRPLPPPDGLSTEVARKSYVTRIQVDDDFRSQWLLMPQPAVDLNVKGRWRFDPRGHDVIGDRRQTTGGLSYKVTSLEIRPTRRQLQRNLSPGTKVQYLALPEMPPIVGELADRAVEGADSPFEQAVKLQDWFTTNFQYDKNVKSGHSRSLIEDFLQKRKGYCEQFAATMAVMARHLSIPSRVAVGFTAGERQPDGSYVVKAHDRHAWPELYFEGVGWLRFEPTPSIDGTNGNGSTPAYARPDVSGTGEDLGNPGIADSTATGATGDDCPVQLRARQECESSRQNEQAPGALPNGGGGGGFPALPVGVVAGVLLLLTLPWLARTAIRRRRLAQGDPELRIHDAWAELRDTVRDYGHTWDRAETPRQLVARLTREASLDGAAAEGLVRVARAVERLRFARTHGSAGADLYGDVRAVRDGLAAGTGRLARWRAVLLPPSTTSLLSLAGERVADALDWIDGAGSRMRRMLRYRLSGRAAP